MSILDVTGGTTLGSNLSTSSPKNINIGTVNEYNKWKIMAEDTQNTTISREYAVTYHLKRFYGASDNDVVTSAHARALPQSALDNASTTFELNTGTKKQFIVLIPATRTITEVMDLATNADVTSQYELDSTAFAVQDAGETTAMYKKYRMTMAVGFSSNHKHRIKIS